MIIKLFKGLDVEWVATGWDQHILAFSEFLLRAKKYGFKTVKNMVEGYTSDRLPGKAHATGHALWSKPESNRSSSRAEMWCV